MSKGLNCEGDLLFSLFLVNLTYFGFLSLPELADRIIK